MQTATSETESKSRDLSICVHHYTLKAPCPKDQGNLKILIDLMRNHRSGPEPSPCPLQAQASGPKISGNLIVGCNGSA